MNRIKREEDSNYLPKTKLNIKHKKGTVLLSSFSLCLALVVTACSEIPCVYLEGGCTGDTCTSEECSEHVHDYSKTGYDSTYHWLECPDDGEIDESSIEKHSLVLSETIQPYYNYELGEPANGAYIYTCTCGYSSSETIENTNIYGKPNTGGNEEEVVIVTQQNLDTIPSTGGTLVLTNGNYTELYLRVSNAVSTSDTSGNHTREVNDLTIKGDGETTVDGLVISDDYHDYSDETAQPVSLGVKTLDSGDKEEDEASHTLILNNLVIEDLNFTSSIRISGNVVINGLTIRNCSYTYPSEYRYTGSDMTESGEKAPLGDVTSAGLLYAVNSSSKAWTNISIDGCSVIEPYYGIYLEGDNEVSITNCYLSSYRFVKYLTSSSATSTGNAAIGTYNELISIKPYGEGSISSSVSITNNAFQGGYYVKYGSNTLTNGSIHIDGIDSDGSLNFVKNVAGDTVNSAAVVATFSNITSSNISIDDNTYTSPTMGTNFSSTFDPTEEGGSTYQWKVMYADSLFTFDNGSDIEYFCNGCWNSGTNLDHADHLNHEHGHIDGATNKDFDAEYDEQTHAMILANYYSSPYMSFYLDFMDFASYDYMVSFDLDFSSFTKEDGEYVSIACCFAHGSYSSMDVKVGYSTSDTANGKTGFYVTAKSYNGSSWDTITHHEEDGKVHIEMNFSKESNLDSTAYYTVNVYEGDYYNKGDLVATISSVQSTGVGTNCIQWCPDAGHKIDTDHDGAEDHYGYTEDGDYVEIDNFGFTLLPNNSTRANS